MPFTLTLVASEKPLGKEHTERAISALKTAEIRPANEPQFFAPEKAADIYINALPDLSLMTALRESFYDDKIDVLSTALENRVKTLAFFDMDSTIVDGETLDEMAALAGVGEEVAAITAENMKNGGDFQTSLRQRLPMLAGHNAQNLINGTLAQMHLNPGAEALIKALKTQSAKCYLFSGGFTSHTGNIAGRLNLDGHHANILDVDENGDLTGKVGNDDDIVDGAKKEALARHYAETHNIPLEQSLAMGDGSNDIPMLKAVGLGIGYKPAKGGAVEQQISNIIRHGDLATAAYAMGLTPE